MNAFVTGASGFIGTHLLKRLVKDGHTVYSLVRTTSHVEELKNVNTKLVYGDVRDQESLEQIFQQHQDIDTVFHLASVLTPISVSDDLYWDINYLGTQNLLEVCRNSPLKAFIYCSSVGVIGPLPEIPATERSRCAPDSNS
jgi:dihydroflavonol-4-reductase